MRLALSLATLVLALPIAVFAQQVLVPKELSGRWTFASAGRSDIFSLGDITTTPDGKFDANLTWWTVNPACTVRGEPISGLVSATGITFDAKTKCDVEFTAVLSPNEKEWTGQATTKGPNSVVVQMRAR